VEFDTWLKQQSKLAQVLLLVIPVVGWIIELLVRISIMARKQDAVSVIVFIVFLVVGWAWILCIIDAVCLALNDKLFLE